MPVGITTTWLRAIFAYIASLSFLVFDALWIGSFLGTEKSRKSNDAWPDRQFPPKIHDDSVFIVFGI